MECKDCIANAILLYIEEIKRLKKTIKKYEDMLKNATEGKQTTHSTEDWIVTKRSYVESLENKIEELLNKDLV